MKVNCQNVILLYSLDLIICIAMLLFNQSVFSRYKAFICSLLTICKKLIVVIIQ